MGWTSDIVAANEVVIAGPDDALFLFDPSEAAGNLTGSATSTSGLDDFGDATAAGFSVYTGNGALDTFLSMQNGGLLFGTNQNLPTGTGGLIVAGPETLRVQNLLNATNPSTTNTRETWHDVVFATGQWSNRGGSFRPVQYRLTNEGNIEVRGRARFTSNGTLGLSPGTVIFGVAAVYGDGVTVDGYPIGAYSSAAISTNRVPTISLNEVAPYDVAVFGVTSSATAGTVADLDLSGVFRVGT